MYSVNNYQRSQSWKNIDRNWKRATWYTGIMAFYEITGDSNLLNQAIDWGAKHGWRIGSEWVYPANRLTCSQTYLKLYFLENNENMIKRTKGFMDKEIEDDNSAFDQGWDYVDALYVGIPAYVMMTSITRDQKYADYGNKIFHELADSLFDRDENLFYRDIAAKEESVETGRKIFWSRGNGWAIASIPRIIDYLGGNDPEKSYYTDLLQKMAEALSTLQQKDGLWRTNLKDVDEYPEPETSGSSFIIYALAWGINNGYLEREKYFNTILKGWNGLALSIGPDGKVQWGQPVAREPGTVSREDSDEYVTGAFLLATSEIYKLAK